MRRAGLLKEKPSPWTFFTSRTTASKPACALRYLSSECDPADQLDISRLSHCPVPFTEILARRIVVERDAIAESLAVTCEVVIVEDVERLGPNFEIQTFFHTYSLRD